MCSIQTMVVPPAWMPRMVATSSWHSPSVSPPAISSSSSSVGAGGERARHLQPLALEQRQRAGRARWRARSRSGPLEDLGAEIARPSRSRLPRPCTAADQQVLEHGQVLERLRDLVASGRCRRGSARAAACAVMSPPSSTDRARSRRRGRRRSD